MTRIFTWSCCLLSLLWRLGGPAVSQLSCPGLPGYRSNHYWLLQNQSLIHCFSEVSSSKVLVLWQFYVRTCILFYREEIHYVCLAVCFEVVTSINTKFTWFINIYMFTFGYWTLVYVISFKANQAPLIALFKYDEIPPFLCKYFQSIGFLCITKHILIIT